MSLFVVGTSAANNIEKFSDGSEVAPKYAEAADVLVGLGIIIGDDENELNPTDNVSREEAAKIIAYLNLGAAKAEKYPARGIYDDVAADRWSAKYVAYGTDAGIINGVGDNKFDPEAEVTGYEFAKMLLVSLGYGENGEYVGDSWLVNVAKDAASVGIFDGVEDLDPYDAATRQQIFQMTFDILDSDIVEYNFLRNAYVPTDTAIADRYGMHLNFEYVDEMGYPSYEWKVGDKTVAGPYYLEADYSTTEPFNVEDIENLTKGTFNDIMYILNGVEVTNDFDKDFVFGGYGVVSRVYLISQDERQNRHLRDIPYEVIVVSNVEYLGYVSPDGKTLEFAGKNSYKFTENDYGKVNRFSNAPRAEFPVEVAVDLAPYAGQYVLVRVYDPQGDLTEAEYDYDTEPLPTTPTVDGVMVMQIAAADSVSGYFKKVTENSITIGDNYIDADSTDTTEILSEACLGYDLAVRENDHLNQYVWFLDSYGNVIGDTLDAGDINIGDYYYINFLEISTSLTDEYVKAYATNAATGEEEILDLEYTSKLYKDDGVTDITIRLDRTGNEYVTLRFKYFNDGNAGTYRLTTMDELMERAYAYKFDEEARSNYPIVGGFWRVTPTSNGARLRSINNVLQNNVNLIPVQWNLRSIAFIGEEEEDYGFINADYSNDMRFYDNATSLTVNGTDTAITGKDNYVPAEETGSIKCLAFVDGKGNASEVYLLDAKPMLPPEKAVTTPGVLVKDGDKYVVRNGTDADVEVKGEGLDSKIGQGGFASVTGENAVFVVYTVDDLAGDGYVEITTADIKDAMNAKIAPNARIFDTDGKKVTEFVVGDKVWIYDVANSGTYIKTAGVKHKDPTPETPPVYAANVVVSYNGVDKTLTDKKDFTEEPKYDIGGAITRNTEVAIKVTGLNEGDTVTAKTLSDLSNIELTDGAATVKAYGSAGEGTFAIMITVKEKAGTEHNYQVNFDLK